MFANKVSKHWVRAQKTRFVGSALALAAAVWSVAPAVAGDRFHDHDDDDDNDDASLVTVGSEDGAAHGGTVDRVSPDGFRTVVSDFSNPAQGPLGVSPDGIQIDASGKVLVLDTAAGTGGLGAVFRINRRNGFRTVLSDFGNPGQGPAIYVASNFYFDARGDLLLVGDDDPTSALRHLVYKIDAGTGVRTVVADFRDATLGPVGVNLERVEAEPHDQSHLLVTDHDFGPNSNGALFRVNRFTGHREVVSDFGNAAQGPLALSPEVFVFENEHQILLTDENGAAGQLFRIDTRTGIRTLVSNFADTTQGPAVRAEGFALEDEGQVLLVDPQGASARGAGALYRIDTATGFRTLVSDFADATQGVVGGGEPINVAIIPDHHQRAPRFRHY